MTVLVAGKSIGSTPKALAINVTPMKRTPSRMAIAVSVAAAFLGSGGLNAGTPLAIASTPVRATEPPANAFRIRKIPNGSTTS